MMSARCADASAIAPSARVTDSSGVAGNGMFARAIRTVPMAHSRRSGRAAAFQAGPSTPKPTPNRAGWNARTVGIGSWELGVKHLTVASWRLGVDKLMVRTSQPSLQFQPETPVEGVAPGTE